MNPEKLLRLRVLNDKWRDRTPEEQAELDGLRTELSLEQQEKPDDPKTWLTDESRRPQLNGIDWNDANHQMACGEVANFFTLLAAKFGEGMARGALEAFLAKR